MVSYFVEEEQPLQGRHNSPREPGAETMPQGLGPQRPAKITPQGQPQLCVPGELSMLEETTAVQQINNIEGGGGSNMAHRTLP